MNEKELQDLLKVPQPLEFEEIPKEPLEVEPINSPSPTPSVLPPKVSPDRALAIESVPEQSPPVFSAVDFLKNYSNPELEQAIKQRDESNFLLNLGKAANSLVAGATRTKTNNEVLDDLSKQSDKYIKDIALKQQDKQQALELQKKVLDLKDEDSLRNPNSDISKFLRDSVKKIGFSIPDSTSGKDLRESGFNLGALMAAHERSLAMNESKDALMQERKERKDLGIIERLQKSFNDDKIAVKAKEGYGAALDAEELIKANNPIGAEAVKASLARLSGEVGVLTDRDVERFGGSRSVSDRVKQSLKTLESGKLTDENRRYMLDLINTFKQRRQQQISDRALQLAKQGAKRFESKTTEDAYEYILPGEKLPSNSSNREPASLDKSKPKSIIQGGHTYILNEQTGQYE